MASTEADPRSVDGTDRQRPLHSLEEVTAENGDLDLGAQDGLVTGDILRDAVVGGGGDLHVQGSLKGEPDHPCRIEVTGHVRIDGAAEQSRIQGRTICVVGDVAGGQLEADFDIEVGGGLIDTEASIGNRRADLSRLAHLKADYDKLEKRLTEAKVKVHAASHRFANDYPQVDLAMGGIIVPMEREVRIDLAPFYEAVADRTPDEIDKALEEFFLRVVVGALTRANRRYVNRNPGRQKIFLKLIEELRSHVLVARAADRLQEAAGEVLKERQVLLDDLKKPFRDALVVGGQVRGDLTVRAMLLGPFEGTAEGKIDVGKTSVEARAAGDGEGPALDSTDDAGQHHRQPLGVDGFGNGAFRVKTGRLVWEAAS